MRHTPPKPNKPVSNRRQWSFTNRYSLMDALMASPVTPLPASEYADRVTLVRAALDALRGPGSSVQCWSICCMVGNVMESMLEAGVVADPDGLLSDAFLALKAGASAFNRGQGAITLTPVQLASVAALVDDWEAILQEAPARGVIQAYRATDRRCVALEAGRGRPTDYVLPVAQ